MPSRNRSGMGRSSGGTLDPRITSAYGSSGRAEPFASDVRDQRRRRRTMDDPLSNHNPHSGITYSNNWSSGSTGHDQYSYSNNERNEMEAGCGFFGFFAFFAIALTIWTLFVYYGNQVLEMGMSHSRVIHVNSFFAKEIQVKNLQDKGPVAYSFSTCPACVPSISQKEDKYIVLDRMHHQRHTYWLNNGSNFEISCTLEDSESRTDSLIVAIVKDGNFRAWKDDPANPSLALTWKRIYDNGSLSLAVEEDNTYTLVFGNLNNREMTFSANLEFQYALHSWKNADLECSSQLTNTCKFPVALGRSTYVLLKSPVDNEHGVDHWKIEVSYIPRWTTYIVLWGLLAAGGALHNSFQV